MDAEVRTALKELRVRGKVATLTRARKVHECSSCGTPIEKGKDYYCIYLAGAGLGDMKFPDRIHKECINDYLNTGGKKRHGDIG